MISEIVPVTFRFPCAVAPRAGRVAILGTFNGWNPKIDLLTKTPQDYWVITIYLSPGRTVYYFDVDGAYWLDPDDEGRIANGWGSEYSVRYVRAGPDRHLPIRGGAQVELSMGHNRETREAILLFPCGDVDYETLPILRLALEPAAMSGRHVVVSLNEVTHISGVGFRLLETCQRTVNERGRRMALAVPSPWVRRLIDLLHLDQVIPVFPSVEAALSSLRSLHR